MTPEEYAKERRRAYLKRWRMNNPDKVKKYCDKQNARMKEAMDFYKKVVKCGDCKLFGTDECKMRVLTMSYDFCSFGERETV